MTSSDVSMWIAAAGAIAVDEGWSFDPVAGVPEGVVCLHSALRHPELGRYTVVASCPVATASGTVDRTVIRSGRDEAPGRVFTDPFEAVRSLLGESGLDTTPGPLPFNGGVIGAFGYGCRRAVERLTLLPKKRQEPDVWFGFFDTWLVFDAWEQTLSVASHGLTQYGARPDQAEADRKVTALWKELDKSAGQRPASNWTPPQAKPVLSRGSYDDAVMEALRRIGEGEIYQACYTFPLVADRGQMTGLDVFLWLVGHSPAPYAALLPLPSGPLVSASPERYLRIVDRQATCRPMKGTRARASNEAHDAALAHELASSEKDRAENLMIVDLMRHDLGRVARVGSVQVLELFAIEQYPRVHQMTSTVTATLNDETDSVGAIAACFPTGSMTGAPKVQAMHVLSELEQHERGWYSGAMGWIDVTGDTNLAVIIRSAIVTQEQLWWHVGGGIVADSTTDGEWEEALLKCPFVTDQPNLAEGDQHEEDADRYGSRRGIGRAAVSPTD